MAINFRARLLELEGSVPACVDRYLELVLDYPLVPGYTERHHILPRSLFPLQASEPENLVRVRGGDHLLAHYWLAKALPESPLMANAYRMMSARAQGYCGKRRPQGFTLLPTDLSVPSSALLSQYEESRTLWAAYMQGRVTVRDQRTGLCIQIPKDQVNPKLHAHVAQGRTTFRDATGTTMSLPVDHPDVRSGKVVHVNKGMTRATDLTTGGVVHITSEAFRADPTRYQGTNTGVPSGFRVNVDCFPILDEAGDFHWVPKDHPELGANLASGRWTHHLKGKLTVKLATGGPSFNVDVDDPRLTTGEVVPQSKGMATVVPAVGGKAFQVPKDDPRIAAGELVAQNAGRLRVLDASGQECRVYPDDPRLAAGELRLKVLKKGTPKVNVYDAAGKQWKVYPHDPRIASGEFTKKTVRKVRWDKGHPQRHPHRPKA